jgi:drug/metabolite transporter (DMT)-like permease
LRPALAAVPTDRLGDVLVPLSVNILGILGATSGTFYQKRFVATDNLAVVTVLQNAGALVATLPVAAATESLTIPWNTELALAMAWVVLGMSIGAMALLSALLRTGAVSRAATLIYLMPPLVALQAFMLFGETLRPVQIAGIAATVLGVALVLRKS